MDTIVSTPHGRLRGTVSDGVYAFLGVPFAAPPFGPDRLRPPRPAVRWDGVRDATRPGASPPQVAPPESAGVDWDSGFTGEDCLNLNLWTPDPSATGLPVMVWIQGGMFEIGSQAAYDGSRFARDGIVCVVINWRVGADGFLFLPDQEPGTANRGLLDQVAALEWVHTSISAFGGDPDNVTVFGESAGAMSIGVLLAMPRAKGLFRRAIIQSGSAHQVTPADTAARNGRKLTALLGLEPTSAAVAAVPVDRLLAAQAELKAELLAGPDPDVWGQEVVTSLLLWQPVLDGHVLPAPPLERIAAGDADDIDLLVGSNADDWRVFTPLGGDLTTVTDEVLAGPVARHGYRALASYGLPAATTMTAYRGRRPDEPPGELLAEVETDWWVRVPSIRLADAHAAGRSDADTLEQAGPGATYMYEFAWPSPGLGAVHALEIPFVFDALSPDARLFGPMLTGAPQELADRMHRAWVEFARTGDPGWPRYDVRRRATMRFGTPSEVVDDPRSWERTFWDGVR